MGAYRTKEERQTPKVYEVNGIKIGFVAYTHSTNSIERLAKGLQLLRTTDFSAMEDGKYEVDGKSLFFMLQSYDSKTVNDRPEAHRKYIDIQYLLKGEEYIGVAPLSEMTEEVSANPDGDIWFYHGPVTNLKIGNGKFAVLFPQDAHAPGIAVETPEPIRKVVVKVLL